MNKYTIPITRYTLITIILASLLITFQIVMIIFMINISSYFFENSGKVKFSTTILFSVSVIMTGMLNYCLCSLFNIKLSSINPFKLKD